jgi:hypothetical protein
MPDRILPCPNLQGRSLERQESLSTIRSPFLPNNSLAKSLCDRLARFIDQLWLLNVPREVSRTGYVKFDGRVGDTLLEAKGYNYKVKNNGEWSDSEGGKRQIAKEAKKAVRQILALQWAEKREGKSLKIELRLAEQKYIKAFQTVLQEAVKLNKTIQSSVTKITFQHVHSEDAKKLYAEHRKKQRKKSTDSSH